MKVRGLAFVGLLLFGVRAEATPAGLTYDAPAACGARADFEARVAERGEHFDASASSVLRVSIREASGAYHGSLRLVGASGDSTLREVDGNRCDEVVSALAVVSAIALRDDVDSGTSVAGATATNPSATPSEPAEPPAVAPPKPRDPAPKSAEKSDDPPRLRGVSPFGAQPPVEVPAGKLRFGVARSLTAFAGGELGILPSTVMPRFDLSLSAASFVTTPDGRSIMTGVIPRLRVSFLGPSTYHAASASVDALGVSAGLGFCQSPFYDSAGFSALICAEYGVGVLSFDLRPTQGSTKIRQSPAFQTAGVGFESEYHLSSLFHVGFKLQLDTSLQPIRATIGSNEIFHSSTISGSGMLGLGVSFF